MSIYHFHNRRGRQQKETNIRNFRQLLLQLVQHRLRCRSGRPAIIIGIRHPKPRAHQQRHRRLIELKDLLENDSHIPQNENGHHGQFRIVRQPTRLTRKEGHAPHRQGQSPRPQNILLGRLRIARQLIRLRFQLLSHLLDGFVRQSREFLGHFLETETFVSLNDAEDVLHGDDAADGRAGEVGVVGAAEGEDDGVAEVVGGHEGDGLGGGVGGVDADEGGGGSEEVGDGGGEIGGGFLFVTGGGSFGGEL
mmetsp:Transcript_28875/g.59194  ORF Transcript_28875/g.59194 Transcript_28875/m.59194 type:complete len:250 (+) Transcript_28875:3232-3981(+)